MNIRSKHCIRSALIAGLVIGVAGCIQLKIAVNTPKSPSVQCCDGGGEDPSARSEADLSKFPPPGNYPPPSDPSGNVGSVNVPIGSLLDNTASTGCFRTSNGWDRYFPMPKLFCGPYTPPNSFCYSNEGNKVWLTVQTCNPSNGTTLRTGIVIANDDVPSDKKCVTNSASCIYSPRLTINKRSMANDTYYRATVFFKSATLGSLTNVVVDWLYE